MNKLENKNRQNRVPPSPQSIDYQGVGIAKAMLISFSANAVRSLLL